MSERDYTVESLKDVLRSHGFVECDIAACNCGSWHHRYGLAARFREICDALTEAGYLSNHNGNIALHGVQELISKAGHRAEMETAVATGNRACVHPDDIDSCIWCGWERPA